MQTINLLDYLKDTKALLTGHFLLTSGRHSDMYIEKFRVLENPDSLNHVCHAMAEIVKKDKIDLVIGAAIGGILVSGGVGRYLKKKHIFTERVKEKMELRRGFSIKSKERVVIVEDIVTTGGSVFELVELVETYDAEIIHIINLVDRSQIKLDFGYPTTSLLKMPGQDWAPSECPLCKDGKPLKQRGRTGK